MKIIMIFLGLIFYTMGLSLIIKPAKSIEKKLRKRTAWAIIFFMLFSASWTLSLHFRFIKEVRIEDLKGNNPYKEVIKETFENGELVKTDTLYVKKNKNK